ncbi:penicillin-binding protein 1A [Candidatus Palauibacter sp.]|uniref:penicillin-binding protein 1A n=1 Tax=Candidatus Palauibacter sp. TaxID=3101350 RepID=UPI003B5A0C08
MRGSGKRRGGGGVRRRRGGRKARSKTAGRDKTGRRVWARGWLRTAAALFLLALAGLMGGAAWRGWTHLCDACPSIAQIYAFEPKEATKLYAADGSLLAELAIERRTPIRMEDLPRHVYNAFIAVEDKRFWGHVGVDLWRTTKAFGDFVLQGYGAAGGSSITQQLAGNMFQGSVDRRDITVRRKLREMRVAIDLERAYTKREILEAYLNQINFDGVFGVQAAAERYFGKTASQLNLPEAALLAAIPRNPAGYNPIRRPERAIGRRNLVLELMAAQGLVSREDAEAAKAYPLELARGARIEREAPYFVEWVRQRLYNRYGTDIYEKGLRVYTTLDPDLQAVADSALLAQLEWVDRHPAFTEVTFEEVRAWPPDSLYQVSRDGAEMPYVQGMFIALDAATGDVRAMVGGRDFGDSEFNRATQAIRQPGSVFKPFVYTTAIASGIPASEIIYDQPYYLENVGGDPYAPSNFDNDFKGPLTLRRALARSINVVAVKLGQRVGEESFAQMAERMGVSSRVPRVPSAAIGSTDLRPIEIATAYTTFANVGVRVSPRSILRVESKDGRVLWESRVQRERVLEPGIAWIAQSMLRDAVDRGTGTLAVRSRYAIPFTVPVAGKTGTTNDATNTWFVGFTPDLVTTTWIGFDRPRRIYRGATGGGTAAPVGAAVLAHYYETHPHPEAWERPEGLIERTVDETTGLLATRWCPIELSYVEIYLEGTEPTETCDAHGPWSVRSGRPGAARR